MKLTNLILSNDEHTGLRILILSGIAWLPLAVLTLIEGTFISDDITIPFVRDVIPYVRALVIIPLLVMADNIIEPMMARIIRYLRESGIVPESEQEALDRGVNRMAHLMNMKRVQLIIVILAISVSWWLRTDYVDMWKEKNVTSWALYLNNGEVDETIICHFSARIVSVLSLDLAVYRLDNVSLSCITPETRALRQPY